MVGEQMVGSHWSVSLGERQQLIVVPLWGYTIGRRDTVRCSAWPVSTGQAGVGGVMVSIVAFQAVDPGSIPGQRKLLNFYFFSTISFCVQTPCMNLLLIKNMQLAGHCCF